MATASEPPAFAAAAAAAQVHPERVHRGAVRDESMAQTCCDRSRDPGSRSGAEDPQAGRAVVLANVCQPENGSRLRWMAGNNTKTKVYSVTICRHTLAANLAPLGGCRHVMTQWRTSVIAQSAVSGYRGVRSPSTKVRHAPRGMAGLLVRHSS